MRASRASIAASCANARPGSTGGFDRADSVAGVIHIAFSRLRTWSAPFGKGLFVDMAALALACRAAILSLATATFAARGADAQQRVLSAKPVCLSAAETRDEVKTHKLLEPFAALKFAAQQRKAEALSAKLCHAGDEFIYEITLLHRDGRLVHVQMEAGTGKLISRPPREMREQPAKNETHDQPVKNESHDQPAKIETHDQPIKNETQDQPVKN
jgi:hypothetical protein